jgi:hypothetical protein
MSQPLGLLQGCVAAATFLLLLPAPRADALPEADTREVRAYVLTEEMLGKYVDATRKLSVIPVECEEEDEADVGSLTEAAARIDAVPGANAAVKSAGMTSRQYVVFAFSLIENAFAAYALEQPGGKLPPGVSMANVEFLRENSGVIEQLANDTEIADCTEPDRKGG